MFFFFYFDACTSFSKEFSTIYQNSVKLFLYKGSAKQIHIK